MLRPALLAPRRGCSAVLHPPDRPLPGQLTLQANPLFASFANPLFEDDDEEEDEFELIPGSQEEHQENAGWLGNPARGSAPPPLLPHRATGPWGAHGRSLAWGSPSPALGGSSGEDCASEGCSGSLLAVFHRQLQSPLVMSALCLLEQSSRHTSSRHPLGADGADCFDCLEGTCAGAVFQPAPTCRAAALASTHQP